MTRRPLSVSLARRPAVIVGILLKPLPSPGTCPADAGESQQHGTCYRDASLQPRASSAVSRWINERSALRSVLVGGTGRTSR